MALGSITPKPGSPSSVVISSRLLGLLLITLAVTLAVSVALTSTLVLRTAHNARTRKSRGGNLAERLRRKGSGGAGKARSSRAGTLGASHAEHQEYEATDGTSSLTTDGGGRRVAPSSSTAAPMERAMHDEHAERPALALLFITRGDMPFSRVWRRFLDSCPSETVSVIVHAQAPQAFLWRYGQMNATLLPDPDLNNPWHRYSMVEIEMRLWEAGLEALRGRPGWLHLADEHSVPLCNCATVFQRLQTGIDGNGPGTSFLLDSHYGIGSDENEWAAMTRDRDADLDKWRAHQHPFKASQWSTLWHEHAAWLVRNREAIRERWRNVPFEPGRGWKYKGNQYAAADEIVVSTELLSRGIALDFGRSLTHVSWDSAIGGPMVHNAAGLRCLALWAPMTGQVFLRKLVRADGVIVDAAISNIDSGGRCPAAIERLAPRFELGDPPGRMAAPLQTALGAGCERKGTCGDSLYRSTLTAVQIAVHCPHNVKAMPLRAYIVDSCKKGENECVRHLLGRHDACQAVLATPGR